MSFDLPASIERDLELYAQAEHISPSEAVIKFVQSGLKSNKRKTASHQAEPIDWEKYRELVPGVALFQSLPDGVLDDMVKGSRRIRAEKLTPRA